MKKLLVTLGFIFFAVEILVGSIYALTFIPWSNLGGFFTERVMFIVFAIVWNIAGAIFLWAGYTD